MFGRGFWGGGMFGPPYWGPGAVPAGPTRGGNPAVGGRRQPGQDAGVDWWAAEQARRDAERLAVRRRLEAARRKAAADAAWRAAQARQREEVKQQAVWAVLLGEL